MSLEDLFWPPWVEIAAGGLGLALALSGMARAKQHGWRGPADRHTVIGLTGFSVLIVIVGVIRFFGL